MYLRAQCDEGISEKSLAVSLVSGAVLGLGNTLGVTVLPLPFDGAEVVIEEVCVAEVWLDNDESDAEVSVLTGSVSDA